MKNIPYPIQYTREPNSMFADRVKEWKVKQTEIEKQKLIEAIFAEWKKADEEVKPGQHYPTWLDNQQLEWVTKVVMKEKEEVRETLEYCEREFERLRVEMWKPSEERESFWISTFFQSCLGGLECLRRVKKHLSKD